MANLNVSEIQHASLLISNYRMLRIAIKNLCESKNVNNLILKLDYSSSISSPGFKDALILCAGNDVQVMINWLNAISENIERELLELGVSASEIKDF